MSLDRYSAQPASKANDWGFRSLNEQRAILNNYQFSPEQMKLFNRGGAPNHYLIELRDKTLEAAQCCYEYHDVAELIIPKKIALVHLQAGAELEQVSELFHYAMSLDSHSGDYCAILLGSRDFIEAGASVARQRIPQLKIKLKGARLEKVKKSTRKMIKLSVKQLELAEEAEYLVNSLIESIGRRAIDSFLLKEQKGMGVQS